MIRHTKDQYSRNTLRSLNEQITPPSWPIQHQDDHHGILRDSSDRGLPPIPKFGKGGGETERAGSDHTDILCIIMKSWQDQVCNGAHNGWFGCQGEGCRIIHRDETACADANSYISEFCKGDRPDPTPDPGPGPPPWSNVQTESFKQHLKELLNEEGPDGTGGPTLKAPKKIWPTSKYDHDTGQEEPPCDPYPCGCDGVPIEDGGGGHCVGDRDTMGNEFICSPHCQIVGADCCWRATGLGIYDPNTGYYWTIVNGEWVYGVYECVEDYYGEEAICGWQFYTDKGHMVVDQDGKWVRRVVQPGFGPYYYYHVDIDGDGVNDIACGFFYDFATGEYHFGCQYIF